MKWFRVCSYLPAKVSRWHVDKSKSSATAFYTKKTPLVHNASAGCSYYDDDYCYFYDYDDDYCYCHCRCLCYFYCHCSCSCSCTCTSAAAAASSFPAAAAAAAAPALLLLRPRPLLLRLLVECLEMLVSGICGTGSWVLLSSGCGLHNRFGMLR